MCITQDKECHENLEGPMEGLPGLRISSPKHMKNYIQFNFILSSFFSDLQYVAAICGYDTETWQPCTCNKHH